ncbi:MAG: F0F1 ATP synthase subunit A [SAR202 cluster bacterium]|nr:F0F1 ATP synthase subunit A [SAR202 cluster bacterium]
MLKSPRAIAIILVVVAVGLISVAGGALGDAFGLGFFSSPIPLISVPAETVTSVAGFAIKNSMIGLWAAGIIVLALFLLGTRKMKLVPGRLQALIESIVEFFNTLVEGVAGDKGRRFLPLVLTIFITIVIANWLNILPGVGTVGRVETVEEFLEHHLSKDEKAKIKKYEKEGDLAAARAAKEKALIHAAEEEAEFKVTVFDGSGGFRFIPFGGRGEGTKVPLEGLFEDPHHPTLEEIEHPKVVHPPAKHPELKGKEVGILVPVFRGAATDLNTTLAIAIVAMVAVQYWGFRSLGVGGYGSKFVNLKQGPIFFAVGLLEIVSEISRVISFTFRLFGNIFAGEILLIAMGFLFPLIGIIPFLGLELFVGLVQAFIFAMLTLVFATSATVGHGEEGHGAEGHH